MREKGKEKSEKTSCFGDLRRGEVVERSAKHGTEGRHPAYERSVTEYGS